MAYEVTIGIPVYNIEKYIRLTLDSALAQTFPDIEIIVVDDCGTDASIDIVRQYQREHPRGGDIRIVRQPHSMGCGATRNRVIDEAQGRYIYFLDGDDTIAPQTIALLHAAAREHDADIVYGSHVRIEEYTDKETRREFIYPHRVFTAENEFATYAYSTYTALQAMTWNFLIRTDIYRRNHIRYKHVNYYEDFTTTMDLPTYVTRAVLLPGVTYSYYCRYGSLSHFQPRKHINKQEIMKTMEAMNEVKQASPRLREKPYYPQRCLKLMKTCYFMVESVLDSGQAVTPRFTRRELRDFLRSPLTLQEILHFRSARWSNLTLWLLGKLPPSLAIATVNIRREKQKIAFLFCISLTNSYL